MFRSRSRSKNIFIALCAVWLVWGLLPPASGTASVARPHSAPPAYEPGPAPLIYDFSPARLLAPLYTGCLYEVAPAVNEAYERELVTLINTTRANQAVPRPPLKRAAELTRSARYHATDMGQDNYFAHETWDPGDTLPECNYDARIALYYSNYSSVLENIANTRATPQQVLNAWMSEATGYRANLLSTDVWEVGAGYFTGLGSLAPYWVVDFGRRANVFPLVINNDEAATSTRFVKLYVYGDWTEMRLRNELNAYTTWMPFQNSFNWVLSGGVGTKTVWVEMRKSDALSNSSATIYLDRDEDPVLSNLPDSVDILYSVPMNKFFPESITLTPVNSNGTVSLTWQLSQSAAHFSLAPLAGTTPASFTLTPHADASTPLGVYTGKATVTVTYPINVVGSPHDIEVKLTVTNKSYYELFLPVVRR